MNLLAQVDTATIVMLIVIAVAIIGLFVWSTISNKKKQKKAQDVLNAMKIGDKIKTIGGVCGFIAEINEADNTIVVETGLTNGEKAYVRFDRAAIYQTAPASITSASAPVNSVENKVEEINEVKVEDEKVEEPIVEEAKTEQVKNHKAE